MSLRRITSVLAVLLLISGGPAAASGFFIYEQGAKASAQAGAFAARANDPSALFYNPAGITSLEGWQLTVGTSLIALGDTEFRDATTMTEDEQQDNAVFPSHLYLTHHASDRISWGLGFYTPFGLETEWDNGPDDDTLVRFSSRHAELVTAFFNPNIAFRLSEGWSLAVGVSYVFGEVKNFSRNIDTSSLQPGTTAYTNLSGDDDDFTFNVATQWKNDHHVVGLTYRGGADLEIDDGDVVFASPPALASFFPDQKGAAALPLPANAALGYAYTGEGWEVEFNVVWTQWSDFEELMIDFTMETSVPTGLPPPFPATAPVVADQVVREDWDDTFSYRVGFGYAFNDQHEFRAGAYFDENPIPDETVRPSLPDADRSSVQLGYGYTSPKQRWSIDAYYMLLVFDDREVATVAADPSVIAGEYETTINLLGASVNWRF